MVIRMTVWLKVYDGLDDIIEFDLIEEKNKEMELPAKRRRKADPSTWNQNVNKKMRALGKEYEGKKYNSNSNTWIFVKKTERKRKELCRKVMCARTNKCCNDFTDYDCNTISEEYCSSGNKNMQDTFIHTSVSVKAFAQKTVHVGDSRRQNTRIFRLKKNNQSLQVCKEMFMNTLCITSYKLDAVLRTHQVGITRQIVRPRNPTPSKGFRWSFEDEEFLAEFFNMIPKALGHYCRKDSSKVYLSIIIPTFKILHEIYQARCRAFGKQPFSITKFNEYLNDKNYSLFKRMKDLCNVCVGYEEGNVTTEEFDIHQAKKEETLNLKNRDKKSAANDSTKAVITADTESLVMAPLNDANIMFFRTKLNLHNFTFYNLVTRDVINFVWSETNGDLKSSSFTTIYIEYSTQLFEKNPEISTIILWIDGCTDQNRCHDEKSVHESMSMYVCARVCMCALEFVCVRSSLYVCARVCMCELEFVCALEFVCVRSSLYVCARVCMCALEFVCASSSLYVRSSLYVCARVCMDVHGCACVCVYKRGCAHTCFRLH